MPIGHLDTSDRPSAHSSVRFSIRPSLQSINPSFCLPSFLSLGCLYDDVREYDSASFHLYFQSSLLFIHPSTHLSIPSVRPFVRSSFNVRPPSSSSLSSAISHLSFIPLSLFIPPLFFSHSLLYLYFLHWSYIPPYIPLFTNLFSLLIFLPSFCIPLRRTGIIIMILIPSILPSHFLSFFLLSSFFHSLFSLCWFLLSIYLPILQLFLMFSSSRDVARRKYWGLMISWGLH